MMSRGWLVGLITTILTGPALAVPLTVSVLGRVAAPGTFDATSLGALPQTTEAVTYTAAGKPVTDTFTGPTLWNVLQAAGGITAVPTVKNGVLRDYVVATGADGYIAVISAGEIAPKFGNRQDLVAISDTAKTLPAPNGFARVVAAGDVAGGRYVSNLVSLAVVAAPTQPGAGGGASSSITVQGGVTSTISLNLAALQALTPYTETVSYTAGGTPVTDTYTGALLSDVLNQAGVQLDPTIKNDVLRKVVTATGTDGYQADFALGEISPSFGDNPILVAYSDMAGQIAGGAGFARLVVPNDLAGGRYVSNLDSLTVFDATTIPEPGSLVLLAAGAVAAGLFHWRGRRCADPRRAAAGGPSAVVTR